MSKRRSAGDIVWKKPNAGFVGEASLVQIQPEEYLHAAGCIWDCGDPLCREWHTLWACDRDGNLTGGEACHVSECELFDPVVAETLDMVERRHVTAVLAALDNNRTQAAKFLDISVRTLQRKLKQWNVESVA